MSKKMLSERNAEESNVVEASSNREAFSAFLPDRSELSHSSTPAQQSIEQRRSLESAQLNENSFEAVEIKPELPAQRMALRKEEQSGRGEDDSRPSLECFSPPPPRTLDSPESNTPMPRKLSEQKKVDEEPPAGGEITSPVQPAHCLAPKLKGNFSLPENRKAATGAGRRHAKERTTCPKCGKPFQNFSCLRRHVLSAHLEKPVVGCKICGKEFRYAARCFDKHVRSSHPESNNTDREYFADTKYASLVDHFLSESKKASPVRNLASNRENNGKASLVGKFLSVSKKATIRTSRASNGQNNGKNHPCPSCGREFTLFQSLQRHVLQAHLKKPLRVCSACGLGFSDSGDDTQRFKAHCQESHKNSTLVKLIGQLSLYRQEVKRFLSQKAGTSDYEQHENPSSPTPSLAQGSLLHPPEQEEKLGEDGTEQRNQTANLQLNPAAAEDLARLKKDFLQDEEDVDSSSSLEKSTSQCPRCGKRFKDAKSLRRHILGVHLEKPIVGCKICGKEFKSDGTGFHAHVASKHPGARPARENFTKTKYATLVDGFLSSRRKPGIKNAFVPRAAKR